MGVDVRRRGGGIAHVARGHRHDPVGRELVEPDAQFGDRAAIAGQVRVVEDVRRVVAERQPGARRRLEDGAIKLLDLGLGPERDRRTARPSCPAGRRNAGRSWMGRPRCRWPDWPSGAGSADRRWAGSRSISNGPSGARLHWISVAGSANEILALQPLLLCMNDTIGGSGARSPARRSRTAGAGGAAVDPFWALADSGTTSIIASAATPRQVFVSSMGAAVLSRGYPRLDAPAERSVHRPRVTAARTPIRGVGRGSARVRPPAPRNAQVA